MIGTRAVLRVPTFIIPACWSCCGSGSIRGGARVCVRVCVGVREGEREREGGGERDRNKDDRTMVQPTIEELIQPTHAKHHLVHRITLLAKNVIPHALREDQAHVNVRGAHPKTVGRRSEHRNTLRLPLGWHAAQIARNPPGNLLFISKDIYEQVRTIRNMSKQKK